MKLLRLITVRHVVRCSTCKALMWPGDASTHADWHAATEAS